MPKYKKLVDRSMEDDEQAKPMDYDDRLKLYTSYAEIGRKWTSVMDSKGTFFSAMNAGILAFLWGSVKIKEWNGAAFFFGVTATVCSLFALIAAILVIAPRESLSILVGKKSPWTAQYKPLSFYGYIARNYGRHGLKDMVNDFRALNSKEFSYEALEQHHSISQVIQRKSSWVFRSAALTFISLSLVVAALLAWICP